MAAPRRDRPSLLVELARVRAERLREAIRRRRGAPPVWPVVAGVAAHLALRPICDPWMNAPSDAKVGTASAVLALPLAFAVFALVRVVRG